MNILSLSFFTVLIIISFSVSPVFALGAGDRNLFLIGMMAFSPLVLIKYNRLELRDVWLITFLMTLVLAPLLNHPESMRWSTVFYSIMFGVTFLAYKQLLMHRLLTIKLYQLTLQYLIYAYAIVLVIQQFCVLTGLPVFNLSNSGVDIEAWKLNSLAAEPSHSGRIVGLLMYSFITVKELVIKRSYDLKLDLKTDQWVWLAFTWVMITMNSATAFLFIPIVLLKCFRVKNLLSLFILVGSMMLFINLLGLVAFERTLRVFMATLTYDYYEVLEADHSAALRILPVMILSEMVEVTSLDGWFGHGIGFVRGFLSLYIPGVSGDFIGGGFFQIWMEFGFLSFILFFIFTLLATFNKRDYTSLIFWFMIVFLNGINSQIIWLCIILLHTNNFFIKKLSIKIKSNA